MTDRQDDYDASFHGTDDTRNGKGSKDKDVDPASKLSHVPCKFFRVGGCTAGNNCPFSHSMVERGAPKETCQWYIKGNCKFGHKCALAHLLPGQPIAMDRKNKKAAQLNNQANANNQGGSDGTKNANNRRGKGGSAATGSTNGREKDRNGESKPDRPTPKPAGNLTATAPVAPSEPSEKSAGDGPQLVSPQQSEATPTTNTVQQDLLPHGPAADTFPSPTASQARPTAAKRFSAGRNGSSDLGYGPIGSPPNITQITNIRPSYPSNNAHNHFSPSTSPPTNHIQPSTSPFAHGEGSQQFFGAYVRGAGERPEQSPIAIQRGPWRQPLVAAERNENAVASDEDDYEDFVPSSLNDLLTPEERQRRLSRSGGSRNVVDLGAEGSVGNIGLGAAVGSMGMGNHRYSRSVPAARLLEAAQVWKDDRDPASISVASLSYRSTGMSDGFSPSHLQLATSNASGAFLHGPHYTRNGHVPVNSTTSHLTRQILSQSYEETDVLGAVPSLSTRGGRYESPYSIQAVNRATQLGGDALSPTSRALKTHAPGQSLPQGLAAGLSRLHFAPPGVGGSQQNGLQKVPGFGVGSNEGGTGGMTSGGLGKPAGVRSPLRSQFLGNGANAVGTPPDGGRVLSFGGLPALSNALSSSPAGAGAVRPSWLQQQQQNVGLMAPPPPKVGTGLGGGLGMGGVGVGIGGGGRKPVHDADDDLFALDDLEG